MNSISVDSEGADITRTSVEERSYFQARGMYSAEIAKDLRPRIVELGAAGIGLVSFAADKFLADCFFH
jgi:hypothetical protein